MESIDVVLGEAAHVRRVVLQTLTQRDQLRDDAATLIERPLLREGRVCGLHFALQGPRNVLLTAIWDAASATLWCYDSSGVRFAQSQLTAAA